MKHKFRHFKNTAGRLAPYISPYRTGFFLSILMVCLTTLTLSISPTVEGLATSLLVKNAQDMLAGIPGACVQFDRLLGFLFILLGLYLLKNADPERHGLCPDKLHPERHARPAGCSGEEACKAPGEVF